MKQGHHCHHNLRFHRPSIEAHNGPLRRQLQQHAWSAPAPQQQLRPQGGARFAPVAAETNNHTCGEGHKGSGDGKFSSLLGEPCRKRLGGKHILKRRMMQRLPARGTTLHSLCYNLLFYQMLAADTTPSLQYYRIHFQIPWFCRQGRIALWDRAKVNSLQRETPLTLPAACMPIATA